MRVVVGKIEGVQSVKVSLKEGIATIRFAPSNRVTIARIREAIRSNGFTPREAEITVGGLIAQRGDTLTLVVPGTADVFLLHNAPDAVGTLADLRRRGLGDQVLVTGQIPRPAARSARTPEPLLVRSFVAARSTSTGLIRNSVGPFTPSLLPQQTRWLDRQDSPSR